MIITITNEISIAAHHCKLHHSDLKLWYHHRHHYHHHNQQWWLFLACEDFGGRFDESFTASVFFFEVEISSRALTPLFRLESIPGDSTS